MTDEEAISLLTEACDEVLEYLRSINLEAGTASERFQYFKKLIETGGGLDQIQGKLSKVLTLTHWEARHGNIPMPRGGPTEALGHLAFAKENLLKTQGNSGPSQEVEQARHHLLCALQAIKC